MIPFASMSKRDLDLRHAARRRRDADELELAERLVEAAISDSPWRTWISTDGWLSSAVVNVSDLRVGIVVLRSISFVNTPPFVSMPSESGVTSRSRTSLTSPLSTPAWIAAPTATTSSGLTPLCGSLPMQLLDLLLHGRHAGHAADEHDVVDLRRRRGPRRRAPASSGRPCARAGRASARSSFARVSVQVEVLRALRRSR